MLILCNKQKKLYQGDNLARFMLFLPLKILLGSSKVHRLIVDHAIFY